MDNQHRQIKGYRDLSKYEVDLMNRIKAAGAELLLLQDEVVQVLRNDEAAKSNATRISSNDYPKCLAELQRFLAAEPFRWAAIAKTDIQTGVMALVRAVAQPGDC